MLQGMLQLQEQRQRLLAQCTAASHGAHCLLLQSARQQQLPPHQEGLLLHW